MGLEPIAMYKLVLGSSKQLKLLVNTQLTSLRSRSTTRQTLPVSTWTSIQRSRSHNRGSSSNYNNRRNNDYSHNNNRNRN